MSIADLLVHSKQVMKFEDTHDLLRRVSGGTGSASPYDWNAMTKAFLIRIHERGIPASKAEMIGDMVANRILDALQADREKLMPAELSVTPYATGNL